jgi:hypothetical protein
LSQTRQCEEKRREDNLIAIGHLGHIEILFQRVPVMPAATASTLMMLSSKLFSAVIWIEWLLGNSGGLSAE